MDDAKPSAPTAAPGKSPPDTDTLAPCDVSFFTSALQGGGAERVMLDLAAELTNRGFRVEIVVLKAGGALADQVPESVHYFTMPRRANPLAAYNAFLSIRTPRRVVTLLENPTLLASMGSKLSAHPHELYLRIDGELMWRRADRRPLQRAVDLLRYIGAKLLYPSATKVLVVSKALCAALQPLFPRANLAQVYNPVGIQPLPATPPKDSTTLNLLAIGRMVPEKGYDTLIRALAELKTPARLTILGEGELHEELVQLATRLGVADRLNLPGFVTNKEDYLATSDVYVLSSRNEGLPTALLEALAADLPIVATDCPFGPDEILLSGQFGRLVPVDDHQAMAQAIDEAQNDARPSAQPELGAHLAQFGVSRATDQFLAALSLPSSPAEG